MAEKRVNTQSAKKHREEAAAKRRALLGPEGEDEPEGGSNLLDADHDEDLLF